MSTVVRPRAQRAFGPSLGGRIVTLIGVLSIILWAGATAPGARAATAVRSHIPTWAFDDGCSGGGNAGGPFVRHWLSYAESNCGTGAAKARRDCHSRGHSYCKVMQYLDTDWDYTADRLGVASVASTNWWLTEPAPNGGARIFTTTDGGGYMVNQTMPTVRSFFRSFVQRHFNGDDGLLMDWQSPSLTQELYYATCGCKTTSEIHTDAGLRRAHTEMSAALTHRNGSRFIQADNTLPGNPYLPQGLNMLNRRIGVDAWTIEGEPMSDGLLTSYYSTLLDQIAYIVKRTRGFVVPMSRAPSNAPYLTQTRRVQEATMLLGFAPGRIVDWADLEQGNDRLSIWPEEGIYPTRPVESMAAPRGRGCLAGTGVVCSHGGHRSLEVAPGVYRREFRSCYRNRIGFGRCATVMNTTNNYITVRSSWLRLHYGHQWTFIGNDVKSGGSVDTAGAPFRAGSTTVAPHDAVLLAP
jgi:hypothetical protein